MYARYSVPVKARLEDHPSTCKIGTLSFSRIKRLWRVAGYPNLHSAEGADGFELFSRLPPVPAHVGHGVTFTFYFEWDALHTAVIRPVAIFEMLVLLCYEVQVLIDSPSNALCI